MLYDLATEPPEPGTLLESVLLLVSLRRREAELLQTEAIVTAVAAAPGGQIDSIRNALKEYKNSVFPFLEAERKKENVEAQKTLEHWVKNMAFKVKPLWKAEHSKKLYSQLRKGMEKTQHAEELRRQKRHTKI